MLLIRRPHSDETGCSLWLLPNCGTAFPSQSNLLPPLSPLKLDLKPLFTHWHLSPPVPAPANIYFLLITFPFFFILHFVQHKLYTSDQSGLYVTMPALIGTCETHPVSGGLLYLYLTFLRLRSV